MEPAEVRGDVMLISALDGQSYSVPKALLGPQRGAGQVGDPAGLRAGHHGWFNRLYMIRFMDLI